MILKSRYRKALKARGRKLLAGGVSDCEDEGAMLESRFPDSSYERTRASIVTPGFGTLEPGIDQAFPNQVVNKELQALIGRFNSVSALLSKLLQEGRERLLSVQPEPAREHPPRGSRVELGSQQHGSAFSIQFTIQKAPRLVSPAGQFALPRSTGMPENCRSHWPSDWPRPSDRLFYASSQTAPDTVKTLALEL